MPVAITPFSIRFMARTAAPNNNKCQMVTVLSLKSDRTINDKGINKSSCMVSPFLFP